MNASFLNSFVTAACRFGHTIINPVLYRLNGSFGEIPKGHLPLHEAFFSPCRIIKEGGIEPLCRAAAALTAGEPGADPEVSSAQAVATKLAATDIQRGQDHKIPPYVDQSFL